MKAKNDISTSDATFRVCEQSEETVDHIVSGCSKFAQREYKEDMTVWRVHCTGTYVECMTYKPHKNGMSTSLKELWRRKM